MIIKKLTDADVEVFKELRLEALHCEPASYASSFEDWVNLSRQEWLVRMSDCTIFAGYKGEHPVGSMALMPQRPSKMAHRASIIMVYVHKSEHGTGLAVSLLETLTNYAHECAISQLELSVSAENAVAIGFYLKQGFSKTRLIPGGYRHEGRDIDDVLMIRRIGN